MLAMAQNPFEKQVGVSQTLSHWHQREPDKGAVIKPRGCNRAPSRNTTPIWVKGPLGVCVFPHSSSARDELGGRSGSTEVNQIELSQLSYELSQLVTTGVPVW